MTFKSMLIAGAWGVLSMGIASCKQGGDTPRTGAPMGAPSRPQPQIYLQPSDLTSSVGKTPLQIAVSNSGMPIGTELLQKIAAAMTIQEWPEQKVLRSVVSRIVDVSGQGDQDQYAHIYFSVEDALSNRWYAMVVNSLPAGVDWPAPGSNLVLADGARVARFNPGSDPVVAKVRAYPGKSVVDVDFSERIVGDARMVSVSNGTGKCIPNSASVGGDPQIVIGDSSGIRVPANAPSEVSSHSVRLLCASSVDVRTSLLLDIQPGIRSASGPPLMAGNAATIGIEPGAWVLGADGENVFIPQKP